mmetsp:Transcript_23825/g.34813  ORF Transcript_23825/g.34813 Transcript_23825/m.34813 type:complete len:521 (-) Transcript_23825:177-1739(-)|eukprot:CAMPEP_0195508422 /NCGR_PEP_ID=MMETSP0794_2-20130614/1630_1 /TAXON_ID=515487 /ORGANISM="Stephanopyxis turris, Strain CCMP 815" /LENGTH=520 /DNA_ID=CAMNT_0040635375 /DNA_START=96 /DNA_END=1658 /DNA_ORIENTATION=+
MPRTQARSLALAAVFITLPTLSKIPSSEASSSSYGLRRLSQDLTDIFFIGDLHGDVHCARKWIERTGFIRNFDDNSPPDSWIWTGRSLDESTTKSDSGKGPIQNNENNSTGHEAMVFLGDYVDKGSNSVAVLNLIRQLETRFPNNIVAFMGNHDLFSLMDSTFGSDSGKAFGRPVHDYVHAFVHPEEYIESGFVQTREDDHEILNALHLGFQTAYEKGMHGRLFLSTNNNNNNGSGCEIGSDDMFCHVMPFQRNPALAERARERLRTWRKEYAIGMVDSGLVDWLTRRPLVAQVGDTLLMHGGINPAYLEIVLRNKGSFGKPPQLGAAPAELSNGDLLSSITNDVSYEFWSKQVINKPHSVQGPALQRDFRWGFILDLVQYRGYFDPKRGCQEANQVLNMLNDGQQSIQRIAVGHTPHQNAHEICRGKVLVTDSSLSRPFRQFGNMYCPIQDSLRKDQEISSSSKCFLPASKKCEGTISRLTRNLASDPWPQHVQRISLASEYELMRKEGAVQNSENDEL